MLIRLLICLLVMNPVAYSKDEATKPKDNGPLIILDEHSMYACDSHIYCQGKILNRVQMSGLFKDSKQFVDMPTRVAATQVVQAFEAIEKPELTDAVLREFIVANFRPVGYDLRIVVPKDWHTNPKFLEKIKGDPIFHKLGLLLHEKWKSLTRSLRRPRVCDDCATTSLELPHPFVIPGGRFREFYYWDSFWILEGLYVSEMWETARGMLENMIAVVHAYGFIPNGSRIYYLNRSQPPLFSQMLYRYIQRKLADADFIKRGLDAADREYAFWMDKRKIEVEYNHAKYTLNMYSAGLNGPRPESYPEDILHASKLPAEHRPVFYRNVAAAAESGWDFSARWFSQDSEMTSMQICSIAPLDLNTIMYKNELVLAELHKQYGNPEKSTYYFNAAKQRLLAIETLFWSDEHKRWGDYHVLEKRQMTSHFYLSDLTPLFFGAFRVEFLAEKLYEMSKQPPSFKKEQAYDIASVVDTFLEPFSKILLDYPGGAPVSEVFSGQQWDFPNVWAPIQFWLLELYRNLEDSTLKEELRLKYRLRQIDLASRWIHSVSCSLHNYGHVFEKYHARLVGQPGGGGEYIVQEGFGWSNAVTLWILDRYGGQLGEPRACSRDGDDRVKPVKPPPDFDMGRDDDDSGNPIMSDDLDLKK